MEKEQIYISNVVSAIHKITGSAGSAAIFHMLITDEIFVKNKWKGLSGVSVDDVPDFDIDFLDRLKDCFVLEYYGIENGMITASVINRTDYVLTEKEYIGVI